MKSLEVQSRCLTLSEYPLPHKKYVRELDSSITLSVALDENDELYAFLKYLDEFVASKNLCPNKTNVLNRKKDPEGAPDLRSGDINFDFQQIRQGI